MRPWTADRVPDALRAALSATQRELSPQAAVRRRTTEAGWVLWDPTQHRRWALVAGQEGLRVYAWDNWYEYDGSYWSNDQKAGVDRGEPSRAVYAFQVLLGHHGVFSLTPLWLLSVGGVGIWLRRPEPGPRGAAACLLLLTVVCLAFYIGRPLMDRNYGGVTCGFSLGLLAHALVAIGAAAGRRCDRGPPCVALAGPGLAADQRVLRRLPGVESVVPTVALPVLGQSRLAAVRQRVTPPRAPARWPNSEGAARLGAASSVRT